MVRLAACRALIRALCSAAWLGRCSSRPCPRRRVHAPTRYGTLCRTRRMRGNARMVGDSSPCGLHQVRPVARAPAEPTDVRLACIGFHSGRRAPTLDTALRQGADVAASDEHLVALDGFLLLGHVTKIRCARRRTQPFSGTDPKCVCRARRHHYSYAAAYLPIEGLVTSSAANISRAQPI